MPRIAGAARVLHVATTKRGVVKVTAHGRSRQLWFVDAQGVSHLQTEALFGEHCYNMHQVSPHSMDISASLRRTPYLQHMARRLLNQQPQPKRVLVLGFGGGLLPAALHAAGAHIVAVDDNSHAIDLARRFFGVDATSHNRLHIHHGDALEFVLENASEIFDACAIDLFRDSDRLPTFLFSKCFHQGLQLMLRPGAQVLHNAMVHDGYVTDVPRGIRGKYSGMIRCHSWERNSAPFGPLSPAGFPRDNPALKDLKILEKVCESVFGNVSVHMPAQWSPNRVLEVKIM